VDVSIQAVAWTLEASQSAGLARLVLISLANHANEKDECWPSQRTIAREAGIALGSVSTQIQQLILLGEVVVVRKGTARRSTRYRIQRSPRERSVQSRTEQNHQEEVEVSTTSSSDGFVQFNLDRARQVVDQRRKAGLKVTSDEGLALSIAGGERHLAESQRLWAHRNCESCKGKGSTEVYAPGTGTRQIQCEELT
jgi:hypothetical protein